jgi:deoxycytidylate deaminase
VRKPDPRTLAIDLVNRSVCHIKVGAVIYDKHGIFAWGWNNSGRNGFGQHAEMHALMRANRKRLRSASIAIAGQRERNGNVVPSPPCTMCRAQLSSVGVKHVYIQNRAGEWITWHPCLSKTDCGAHCSLEKNHSGDHFDYRRGDTWSS